MTPRRLAIAAACAVAALLAYAYASPYGTSNQQTYLLEPLARAFPTLYRRDWFVTQVHHYNDVFTWVTAPLYALDARGVVAFAIVQLVAMTATYLLVFGVVATVGDRARLAICVALAGLLALGGGRAMGGSYLFAGYLQPSSFAVIGWLVALLAWVRDRPLAAGLALAAGGAFHLNYVVLGIGVFGAAELACSGGRVNGRRLAALLAPSLVVLALYVPQMIASSRSDEPDLALRALVKFEFARHFDPHLVRRWMYQLAAFAVVAWSLAPAERSARLDRLLRFAIVATAACVAAVLVASIALPVTRLFACRIAPIALLASEIVALVGVVAIAGGAPAPSPRRLGVLAVALVVIVRQVFRFQPDFAPMLMVAFAGGALAAVLRRRWIVAALAGVLLALAINARRAELADPPAFDDYESGVVRWARTASAVDAVFLVPPYLGEFRLLARRAVVVDTKSPPMYMDEVVAWYRRVCAIVDANETEMATFDDADTRWDALPADRFAAIARRFDADFVLLDKARSKARLAAPIAFEDDGYVVYRAR